VSQRRNATVAPRRLRPETDDAAIVRLVDAVLLELLSAMILSSGRPRPPDAERFLRRVKAIMVCY
jgi:hypothetical protein